MKKATPIPIFPCRLLSTTDSAELKNENPLSISQCETASELGTVSEAISKLMRKLEKEGRVEQNENRIRIFG